MDGVLVDFNKAYSSMFGVIARHDPMVDVNWFVGVDNNVFLDAEMMPDASRLIDFVLNLNVEVEILSSLSYRDNHEKVQRQKEQWLEKRGLFHLPRNFVRHKHEKALYAAQGHALIDDSWRCIEPFGKAGGYGILHIDANTTINELIKVI